MVASCTVMISIWLSVLWGPPPHHSLPPSPLQAWPHCEDLVSNWVETAAQGESRPNGRRSAGPYLLKTPPTIAEDVPNECQCSSWANYDHNAVDHTSMSKSSFLCQNDDFAIVVLFCFFSINAFLLFFLRHSNQEVVEVTFCNSFRLCLQRGASNPCNRGNSRNFCRKQRRRSPQDNASSDCLLHIHPYTLLCKYTYTRHTIHKSFSESNRL